VRLLAARRPPHGARLMPDATTYGAHGRNRVVLSSSCT
jgi:hypothetical protein